MQTVADPNLGDEGIVSGPEIDAGMLTRRFPTDGDKFFRSQSAFDITFDSAQTAFGFYATDMGDFNGQLTVQLDGGDPFIVDHTRFPDTAGGSLLFWGVLDTMSPFSTVSFSIEQDPGFGAVDFAGFDELVVARGNDVPVPGTLLLYGLGLALLGKRRRR